MTRYLLTRTMYAGEDEVDLINLFSSDKSEAEVEETWDKLLGYDAGIETGSGNTIVFQCANKISEEIYQELLKLDIPQISFEWYQPTEEGN